MASPSCVELGMRVYRAIVIRTEDVSPSLRRIVFGGPDLGEVATTGCGDEYLRVILSATGVENDETWTAQHEALDESIRAGLEAPWTTSRSEDEIEAEYDERLTEVGP